MTIGTIPKVFLSAEVEIKRLRQTKDNPTNTARPIREELAESKQKNFMLEQARDRAEAKAETKNKQLTTLRKRLKTQAKSA